MSFSARLEYLKSLTRERFSPTVAYARRIRHISFPMILRSESTPVFIPRPSSESSDAVKTVDFIRTVFRVLYFLIRRHRSTILAGFVRALFPRIGRILYRYSASFMRYVAACTMKSLYAHLDHPRLFLCCVCAYVIARTWSRGIGAKKFCRHALHRRQRRQQTIITRQYIVTQRSNLKRKIRKDNERQ